MANVKMSDAVRAQYVEYLMQVLKNDGEDVRQSKSNEFAFPVCDAEGGEHWVKIVVSVPKGARDEQGYDGYGLAEAYQLKLVEKAEKAAAKRKEEAEKQAKRAAKLKEKADREA